MGHSMGFSVAARFGADHPDRVKAVVLLDGGLPLLPENIMSEEEPVRPMRAERGIFDDGPLIPQLDLDEYLPAYPHISVEMVPGVNHFTLIIGDAHGPRRAAATLTELALT